QPCKAYLIGVSINAEVRNQGYGTSLLWESFSYLARENIREVELTVSPGNSEAIILYQEKLGFVITDFREDEYGAGQHRVVMSRLIK
ncbi:MAG: GNAT family N-acetyltransferase, partial [Syntrophomonas sp.]